MDVNIQKSGVVNYTADLGVFEAITSTTTGEIATFESNVLDAPCPSVLCTINPVQDLHGQDYPYPSGGGKNLIPSLNPMPSMGTVLREFSTPLSVSYVTISFKFTGSFANGGAALIVGKDSDNNNAFLVAMGWFKKASDNTPLSANTTYTNELVYFSASVTAPIKSIVYTGYSGFSSGATLVDAMIETGSTRTAYAPYSNICPITGHTELNLVHTGANLWDEVWEVGNIDSSGTDQPTDNSIRSKNYTPCIPNTNYYKYIGGSKNGQLFFYEKDKTFISRTGNAPSGVVTSPSNAYFMRFASYSDYGATYNHDISINYPSTDTSYHAYTGTTTTTALGTTVYGCMLEVVSGVLTIDMVMIKLKDLTYEAVGSGTSARFQVYNFPQLKPTGSNTRLGKSVCTTYPVKIWNTLNQSDDCYMVVNGSSSYMAIRDTRYSNATDFYNSLTDNDYMCYEMQHPITTQLTPQEVKSLLGSNNFYHDCNGQVAVTHFTIRSYSLDGFFENNTDRLSISQTFINTTDFIEI